MNVKQLLEVSRAREKKLATALEDFGVNVSLVVDLESGLSIPTNTLDDTICPLEPHLTFTQSLLDRGLYLGD